MPVEARTPQAVILQGDAVRPGLGDARAVDGAREQRRRRIPRPLDDWTAFDGWLALGLFLVWGFLASASALLSSWAVWIDDSGPPDGPLGVVAQIVAGWSPTILILLAGALAVVLRRRGDFLSWVPACGIVLVFVLRPVGQAIGRAAHGV